MTDNSKKPLQIKRRGEDGNKVITVRIKESTLNKIDEASQEINCSRNELINILLEHGIENIEVI